MTDPDVTTACGEAMPQAGLDAIALFNAGEYYAQHDAFEVLWMEEVRPVRDLYRAILQVGVAYYHVTEGNRMGALKMLKRSERWLNKLPDVCQGVDVARLRADSRAVRDALLGAGDDLVAFDRSLLKGVRLVADQ
jgi:predicted metal-dependent hydrolase